jgi:hypothetical protein
MSEVSSGRARHGRPTRWQTLRRQTLRRQRIQWPPPQATLRRPSRRPALQWPTWPAGAAALRVVGAIAVGVVAVVIAGWSPGVVGVLAGVLTWLLLTAWHALARRRSN